MRRTVVIGMLVLLAVPAGAAARALAPGDGTLAVRGGDGQLRLAGFKGTLIGKIGLGTLVIVDPKDGDCDAPLVWDADVQRERERVVGEETRLECVFRGRDMRFRLVGGENTVRLNGLGISLSAVGKGMAALKGAAWNPDGLYAVESGEWRSLPDEWRFVRIGSLP